MSRLQNGTLFNCFLFLFALFLFRLHVVTYGQIILVVDNTFLTPYFQRPLQLGADIVIYSLAKYMNGHSDVVMGAAVTNDDDLFNRLKLIQIGMYDIIRWYNSRFIQPFNIRRICHHNSYNIICMYLQFSYFFLFDFSLTFDYI